MTESLMSRDNAEARKKGLFALSAWAHARVLRGGRCGVSHLPLVHVPSQARNAVLGLHEQRGSGWGLLLT